MFETVVRVIKFVRNTAEEQALLLPGRVPGFKRIDVKLLPSNLTKHGLWKRSLLDILIFGVCCQAIPRQVNFLIDENVMTGKGANSTISYVHYFLKIPDCRPFSILKNLTGYRPYRQGLRTLWK